MLDYDGSDFMMNEFLDEIIIFCYYWGVLKGNNLDYLKEGGYWELNLLDVLCFGL